MESFNKSNEALHNLEWEADNFVNNFVSEKISNFVFWDRLLNYCILNQALFIKIFLRLTSDENSKIKQAIENFRTAFWNNPNSFQKPSKITEIDSEDKMMLEMFVGKEENYKKKKTGKEYLLEKLQKVA